MGPIHWIKTSCFILRADLKEDEKKLPMETITEKDEQSRLSTAVKKKSDNNGVRGRPMVT